MERTIVVLLLRKQLENFMLIRVVFISRWLRFVFFFDSIRLDLQRKTRIKTLLFISI